LTCFSQLKKAGRIKDGSRRVWTFDRAFIESRPHSSRTSLNFRKRIKRFFFSTDVRFLPAVISIPDRFDFYLLIDRRKLEYKE